jgi:hypothetical protein
MATAYRAYSAWRQRNRSGPRTARAVCTQARRVDDHADPVMPRVVLPEAQRWHSLPMRCKTPTLRLLRSHNARQRADDGQPEHRVKREGERISEDDVVGALQNAASKASHSRPSACRASSKSVPSAGSKQDASRRKRIGQSVLRRRGGGIEGSSGGVRDDKARRGSSHGAPGGRASIAPPPGILLGWSRPLTGLSR